MDNFSFVLIVIALMLLLMWSIVSYQNNIQQNYENVNHIFQNLTKKDLDNICGVKTITIAIDAIEKIACTKPAYYNTFQRTIVLQTVIVEMYNTWNKIVCTSEEEAKKTKKMLKQLIANAKKTGEKTITLTINERDCIYDYEILK